LIRISRTLAIRDIGCPGRAVGYVAAMPTNAEIREQLTGPGGMFEITTDLVLGREQQVYANRMPSLRSVAEVGLMRGDDATFISYGDREYGFATFVQTANGVAHALRDRFGVGKGDR